MPDDKLLALPGSSWETAKKIIRAFGAVQNEDNPRVEDIAKLAGVPRPVVSMNNAFLRSVGIVRPDQWKLTEGGRRYVTALQLGHEPMAAESLADTVQTNPVLRQILSILTARGGLKADTLKAELILKLGLDATERQNQFKPLFDMLQEARLIEISGDTVNVTKLIGSAKDTSPPTQDREVSSPFPPVQSPPVPTAQGLPILLGPNRIAYIQLPNDWDKKDLPKLLKLLELSLGDDV